MNHYSRIKALQIGKRKSFRLLLAAEFLLLLAGVAGLFGKDAVYQYGMESMRVNFGSYSEEYGGISVENPQEQGHMVDFAGIVLPKGTYRVQLDYDTDVNAENTCRITNLTGDVKSTRTNEFVLYAGLHRTDFDLWLDRDSELMVHANHMGGKLAVSGLTIRQTNGDGRVFLFKVVVLSVLVNCVYLYLQYDRKYAIPLKNKRVTFSLGLVILAASIPLTVDYMLGGGDLVYHLMRVEGIKDGIGAGQFPVRISPEWQQGYGYASPVFYGETLLYPAGLLRLAGFTVTSSYRIFMFAVTVATVLIAYYCFKKVFGEAYLGVFCSGLYSLSVYRIYKTYNCGSWGECFGIMLLPLLLYGFWRVFTQDLNEESYKRSWVPLTAGFALLIQSHLLTCEMVGFFTVVLCIVLWRRVFRPRTFVVLAKTVIYSVLLSAWFLVPFGDYMLTGDFVIHHVSERTIQNRGLLPAHLLFTFFVNGDTVFFDQSGMVDTAAMGVGPAMAAGLAVLAYLWFDGRLGELKKEERVLGGISGGWLLLPCS